MDIIEINVKNGEINYFDYSDEIKNERLKLEQERSKKELEDKLKIEAAEAARLAAEAKLQALGLTKEDLKALGL